MPDIEVFINYNFKERLINDLVPPTKSIAEVLDFYKVRYDPASAEIQYGDNPRMPLDSDALIAPLKNLGVGLKCKVYVRKAKRQEGKA